MKLCQNLFGADGFDSPPAVDEANVYQTCIVNQLNEINHYIMKEQRLEVMVIIKNHLNL